MRDSICAAVGSCPLRYEKTSWWCGCLEVILSPPNTPSLMLSKSAPQVHWLPELVFGRITLWFGNVHAFISSWREHLQTTHHDFPLENLVEVNCLSLPVPMIKKQKGGMMSPRVGAMSLPPGSASGPLKWRHLESMWNCSGLASDVGNIKGFPLLFVGDPGWNESSAVFKRGFVTTNCIPAWAQIVICKTTV